MEVDDMTTDQKKAKFLELFPDLACNIQATCEAMKISRRTFYNWRADDEEFAEKIEDELEGMIDFAESKLMQNIKSGKEASVFFFLKTKAKHRGYIEKYIQQHEGNIKTVAQLVREAKEESEKTNDEETDETTDVGPTES